MTTVELAQRADGLVYRAGTADEWIMRESPYGRLLRIITSTDRVLDLGGYIGTFAIDAVRAGARVLSVEPSPANFAVLRKNASRFGFEAIDVAAVPDHVDVIEFSEPINGRKLPYASTTRKLYKNDYRRITVKAMYVADLQRRHAATIIKMDVEGLELDLLRTLDYSSRLRALAVEYNLYLKGQRDHAIESEKVLLGKGFMATGRHLAEHSAKSWSLVKMYVRES